MSPGESPDSVIREKISRIPTRLPGSRLVTKRTATSWAGNVEQLAGRYSQQDRTISTAHSRAG